MQEYPERSAKPNYLAAFWRKKTRLVRRVWRLLATVYRTTLIKDYQVEEISDSAYYQELHGQAKCRVCNRSNMLPMCEKTKDELRCWFKAARLILGLLVFTQDDMLGLMAKCMPGLDCKKEIMGKLIVTEKPSVAKDYANSRCESSRQRLWKWSLLNHLGLWGIFNLKYRKTKQNGRRGKWTPCRWFLKKSASNHCRRPSAN